MEIKVVIELAENTERVFGGLLELLVNKVSTEVSLGGAISTPEIIVGNKPVEVEKPKVAPKKEASPKKEKTFIQELVEEMESAAEEKELDINETPEFKKVTRTELRSLVTRKSRELGPGAKDKLKAVLDEFGVTKVSDLDDSVIDEFAQAIKELE